MIDVIKKFKKPYYSEGCLESILEMIKEGNLSIKSEKGILKETEGLISKLYNHKDLFILNNGTAALFSAFQLLNLKEDDEVIIPSFLWHACAAPLNFTKAKIRVCDISVDTLNIDENKLEKLINKNTKAILIVHLFGHPAPIDRVLDITKGKNIKIIEDCSHAFNQEYKGRLLGTYGDMACFSFQQSKLITGGEIGAILLNKQDNIENLLQLALPGRKSTMSRGVKFRPHPLAVRLLNDQLNSLNDIQRVQSQLAGYIKEKLSKIKDIDFHENTQNRSYFNLRFSITGVDRGQIIEKIKGSTNLIQAEDYFIASEINFLNYLSCEDQIASDIRKNLMYCHIPKKDTRENMELLDQGLNIFLSQF